MSDLTWQRLQDIIRDHLNSTLSRTFSMGISSTISGSTSNPFSQVQLAYNDYQEQISRQYEMMRNMQNKNPFLDHLPLDIGIKKKPEEKKLPVRKIRRADE